MAWFSPSAIGTGVLSFATVTPVERPPGGPVYVRDITLEGDYLVDPGTKQFKQTTLLRQMTIIALQTRRGTCAADPTLGVTEIPYIDQDFEAQVEADRRRALDPIVRYGVGVIEDIEVERDISANVGRAGVSVTVREKRATEPTEVGPFEL